MISLFCFQLVGLAFEVHDTYMNKKAAEKEDVEEKIKLQIKYQSVSPTFADMMLYSYCYVGLLTGKRINCPSYIHCHRARLNLHIQVTRKVT